MPLWILRTPDIEREQGGLADAVGPDQSRHAPGGNIEGDVVERERVAVAVRHPLDPGDNGVGHCGKFHHELGGPSDLGIGAHETEAAHTCFHRPMVFIQHRGVALELDSEHELLALLGRFDALRRELGVRRHEADTGGEDILREWIEDDTRLIPERELSRHIGRQVDGHVDVFEIEDGQHALSCGNHLTGAGQPVLHASASRGYQHQVDQYRLQPLDIGLGCPDRSLGLIPLSSRRHERGVGRLELVAPQVHRLLGDGSVLKQRFPTLVIRSGEIQIALALCDECNGFRQCLLRLDHLCLCSAQLSFGFRRGDGGDDIAGRDLVTFVLGHRRQSTRVFCRYVHLRCFDAAVGLHDPLGHVTATQPIDQRFHGCTGSIERVLLRRLRRLCLRSAPRGSASRKPQCCPGDAQDD